MVFSSGKRPKRIIHAQERGKIIHCALRRSSSASFMISVAVTSWPEMFNGSASNRPFSELCPAARLKDPGGGGAMFSVVAKWCQMTSEFFGGGLASKVTPIVVCCPVCKKKLAKST